jgi:hypothetical protein
VVVAKLLDLAAANAVGPAVADVADPGAFGPQQERGGGGAHPLELAVGLAAGVDAGVGLLVSLAQGGDGALGRVLVIRVGDDVHGQLGGQFADRVAAHAVGHNEDVSLAPPLRFLVGQEDRTVVLVVGAADPHVRGTRVLDVVEASHQRIP